MALIDSESPIEMLTRLTAKMESVRGLSLNAELMVQRAEGDLMRIMNSTWLNLSDIEMHTKKTGK
jgi:hypothetical protein